MHGVWSPEDKVSGFAEIPEDSQGRALWMVFEISAADEFPVSPNEFHPPRN